MKIHRLYVVRIVCIPMFMNSNAELQTEYSHIRPVNHVTKNVCKNVAKTLIAKVQPAAIGQEQVVQKQKPVGVKKLAKFSLVKDL